MNIDLDQLSKEEHYTIPEHYFDELPGVVMSNIRKEKAHRRNLWVTAAAAVIALVICSTIVVNYITPDNASGTIVAEEQVSGSNALENQMVDYYSSEFAQMDYYNY